MATKTLRELLERELESQNETAEDIQEICVSKGVGYRVDGWHEDTIEGLEDYEGDPGFGGQRFPNLYVYTEDRVYFKTHYDGSESVRSLPRNPTDETPKAFGGG